MHLTNSVVFLLLITFYTVECHILLVAHSNGILQVDLAKNTSVVVVDSEYPVVAFDIHQAWGHVYWATDHKIYRTPLYDSKTTTTIAEASLVGSLVVDWVHNRIYWTDLLYKRIEAAHLDGLRRRIVYWSYDRVLGALALDPYIGKLFWLESKFSNYKHKTIKSSDTFYTGSNVKTLYFAENIQDGSPLAVNVVYNKLFFYQTNNSQVEQWEANYVGLETQAMLFGMNVAPIRSVTPCNNGFFFSNMEGLFYAELTNSHQTLVLGNQTLEFVTWSPKVILLNEELRAATQVRVLSKAVQPRWSGGGECRHHPCQHECHLRTREFRTSPTCDCDLGHVLNEDNRTCTEEGPAYYLFSTATSFIRMTRSVGEETVLYRNLLANIQSFDVDIKSGNLFWIDTSSSTIYRAPVEVPARSEPVVQNVTAYGVAVDWIHDHIYWSEDDTISVASLDGDRRVVLLSGLSAPGSIAVDPIHRFIFWAECGQSLSIRRAGLDGSDVTTVVSHVACGASLSIDPKWFRPTLYYHHWQDNNTVHVCKYDNTCNIDLISELSYVKYNLLSTSGPSEPTGVKVISISYQPQDSNTCEETDCPGLCIPLPNVTLPVCLCSAGKSKALCADSRNEIKGADFNYHPSGYLDLVEATSFYVKLKCAGALLRSSYKRPFLQVTETSSLVPRNNVTKLLRVIPLDDKSVPFTIDDLNPATTYLVSVRNRVTRASCSLVVHTAPPPLEVRRLPIVSLPGVNLPVQWLPRRQGVHYSSPNPWENLLNREFVLLLISRKYYSLANPFQISNHILNLIGKEVKDNFTVLSYYKREEEFDDDPEMHLWNLPWGEVFHLAMVQVTEYMSSYHLDVVYSERFGLPDPYWSSLLERILQDQK